MDPAGGGRADLSEAAPLPGDHAARRPGDGRQRAAGPSPGLILPGDKAIFSVEHLRGQRPMPRRTANLFDLVTTDAPPIWITYSRVTAKGDAGPAQ